jgi:light-regulated signal transduction histidine kinase (bacteriophytochrome)
VALRESDSAKELQAQSLRAANLQLKLAMEQSVEAERAKDEALQTQEQIARALERALTRTAEVNWELENANIRLRILNSELDDFTHVVSHDLKEPLRGMQAFAQFLLEDYSAQLDDVGRTYLTNIMSSAQRMQQLIQDLLELSRVSRKAARLEKTSARVALTAALEDLTYSIERRSAVIELPETDARVMADSAQLRSIFKNLISNAIKYNEQTVPTVRIDWRLDEGRWLVSVQDNGIGIDMRYHERIFELFERLVSRQQYEGTGAGLAITRKMVEQHGGKIWIESAPGQGSTFYFSLAVAAPEDNTESSQT